MSTIKRTEPELKLIPLGSPNCPIELGKPPIKVQQGPFNEHKHVLVFAERGHRLEKLLDFIKNSIDLGTWLEFDLSNGELESSATQPPIFIDLQESQQTESLAKQPDFPIKILNKKAQDKEEWNNLAGLLFINIVMRISRYNMARLPKTSESNF